MEKRGRGFGAYICAHRYILLLLYVPIYIISFFAVELFVPESADYWVSHCFIDDLIPFCEYFVVFYCMWYPFLFAVGIYLLWKDVPMFRRYMYWIMTGFSVCVVICILFPNGQDLRPQVFPRDNGFADLVKAIYAVDTNTNVIPSVHAVGSIFVAMAVCEAETIKKKPVKAGAVVLAALICISTCLIKQHSVLDVLAAAGLCAAVYAAIRIIIKNKLRNS